MPIRLRARAQSRRDASPVSARLDFDLPDIAADDDFRQVVKKLSIYITDVIELPSTFEQLRTTAAGNCLRVLVDHLGQTCTNPAIVNALLALKWHYVANHEYQSLGEARSNACEIVAWRFLSRLSERDAVDYCLFELPDPRACTNGDHGRQECDVEQHAPDETAPLLSRVLPGSEGDNVANEPVGSSGKKTQLLGSLSRLTNSTYDGGSTPDEYDPATAFKNLNALEIAAIAKAKRFLSQHVVQKIITGIWNGDIVFWSHLSVHATKQPRFHDPRAAGSAAADPFSRLRVPKYLKAWEVLFFAAFLCLYYTVLVVRDESRLTGAEVALFVWIAAFFYDELCEWADAGSIFYAADVWNLFDMIMILIGFVFAILRIIGITQRNDYLNDLAFDVLSLEALFMIPRICSILSLSPYWGTLIPCLKEMGKDFIKFMVLVVIVYIGFLTTFSLVGRNVFSLSRMTFILTKIFFGSSYVGFEIMDQIDPVFGPPLMLIFITLTSILLTGSLTGILSNSFSRVTTHSREEYLYVYSVYVLEASTSNRLVHFLPPFNLISLIVFRPWRLFFPKDRKFRAGRILLLKITHLPIVAAIQLFEFVRNRIFARGFTGFDGDQKSSGGGISQSHEDRDGPPASSSNVRRRRLPQPVDTDATRLQGGASEDDVDAPSSVEVQIEELHRKIDQLTTVVLAMQDNQPGRTTPERDQRG